MTVQEAIEHCEEKAKEKYTEGMLCHANPNDDLLDECIKCAKEHEQLAEWLNEVEQYRALGTVEELKEAREKQVAKKVVKIQIPNTSFSRAQTRYACPICRKFYEGTDYCTKCGQKLDWSK